MNKQLAESATPHADRYRLPVKSALCRRVLRAALAATAPLLAISACTSQPPVASSHGVRPEACQPSQLAFSLDDGNGRFNGMSHSGTMLILRNAGTAACTIPAQPVPGFTDANKQPLGIAAQAPADMQRAPALPPIVVAPGESVESEMRWVSGSVYDHGHCESPAFVTLAIGKQTVSTAFAGHLCGAGGKPSTYALKSFRSATAPTTTGAAKMLSYTCDDGRTVQAVYPDPDTAVLTVDRQTHRLHITLSADGARYVGDRWQWWTKGMHQAWLAMLKPGEEYASGSGIGCHAP